MGRKKTAEQRRQTQLKLRARTKPPVTWTPPRSGELKYDMPSPKAAPPTPEAVAAYADVWGWALDNPDAAADLACLDESDWAGPLAGLAYPEKFAFPHEQEIDVAWTLRAWHILNGVWYTLDWPEPVATMSEEQIIAQLRADGAAGKITLEGNPIELPTQP